MGKDLLKIVTYPLILTALFFVALYGIIDPQRGRYFYTEIALAWSQEKILNQSWMWGFLSHCRPIIGLPLCMISTEDLDRNNLYQLNSYYEPMTLRSLSLSIKNQLLTERPFFESLRIDVVEICQRLDQIRRAIGWISGEELYESKLYPFGHDNIATRRARVDLLAMKTSLMEIKAAFDQGGEVDGSELGDHLLLLEGHFTLKCLMRNLVETVASFRDAIPEISKIEASLSREMEENEKSDEIKNLLGKIFKGIDFLEVSYAIPPLINFEDEERGKMKSQIQAHFSELSALLIPTNHE